jgi:hypothetical protein
MLDRMKTLMTATAGILVLVTPALAQEAVRIGTSSVGSNFYRLAVGAGEVIHKKAGINTTVESVGGSAATVRSLGRGKIEFGLANAFASVTGYKGTFSFKKSGRVAKLRLALQGQPNHRSIVVRKRAGIKTAQDLKGKTMVGSRRPLPEIKLITAALFKYYKIDPSSVKVVGTTNTGQVIKALTIGSVDAAVVPLGPKAANWQKPLSDGVIEFFDLPVSARDAMLKDLPGLIFAQTFGLDAFVGLKKPVPVFAMNTLFVTRPGVSNERVYKVVKSILENNKLFVSYHHQAKGWTLKNALTNVQLPFHPGAIRYFKEVGAWTPALAANQKKLLR